MPLRFGRLTLFCGFLCLLCLPAGGAEPAKKQVAGKTLKQWTAELRQGDDLGRLEAVRTLPLFGGKAAAALQDALADKNPGVRAWAATALGDLRGGDMPVLAKLLEDDSLGVRIAAAYAVYRQKPGDKALDILTGALSYPGRGAPIQAADFLGKLQVKAALPALREAVKSKDYHVRNAAARAIRHIEQPEQKE